MKTVATLLIALLTYYNVSAADVKAGALKTPVSLIKSLIVLVNGNDCAYYA